MRNTILISVIILSLGGLLAYTSVLSSNPASEDKTEITTIEMPAAFNNYWYAGEAEITSFELEQARYGELHTGKAVMVFVTEDFSKDKQVKADTPKRGDIPVMKLNYTKKFNTGIYPYSMMTSTFVPVQKPDAQPIKITTSSQEWCGHTFTQLNNRNGKYEIESRSYFESEGDQSLSLEKALTEDELWTRIRLNPESLPIGNHDIIPSFFHVRLMHKPMQTFQAEMSRQSLDNNQTGYTVSYKDLDRQLTIVFQNDFPYEIMGWEETYTSGWGKSANKLTTKATRIKTLKSDYWNRHNNEDLPLRAELGL